MPVSPWKFNLEGQINGLRGIVMNINPMKVGPRFSCMDAVLYVKFKLT